MLDYSSMGRGDLESEVDRYITIPGQACSYKIGELKILELRKLAEKELGKIIMMFYIIFCIKVTKFMTSLAHLEFHN